MSEVYVAVAKLRGRQIQFLALDSARRVLSPKKMWPLVALPTSAPSDPLSQELNQLKTVYFKRNRKED